MAHSREFFLDRCSGMNTGRRPGLTDITRIEIDKIDDILDGLDRRAEISVTPAFLPSARIACSERCTCGLDSACTVMMSDPALANASR